MLESGVSELKWSARGSRDDALALTWSAIAQAVYSINQHSTVAHVLLLEAV